MKTLQNILTAVVAAFALLSGVIAGAQSLPNLGKASEITVGSLPNGISYYLVDNSAAPGFADFALVQPARSDRKAPREDLVELPHFYGRKPYDFLASHAVGYGPRGFIQHYQDATVFRFADVPVGRPAVCDSTLLMLFDIAGESEFEQAVVVSGNIDKQAITERLRVLSMTISRRKPLEDTWNYGWKPQDQAMVTTATGPVGVVTLHYRSPRTERELMNTIQPIMSRLLAGELDIVLKRRLRAAFSDAQIPLADYRYRYIGSDETSGDEIFSLTVFTAPDQLEDATRTLGGVLSSLVEDGTTLEEVAFARTVIAEATRRESANYKMSNAEYADKCIAAYLYGSNLASVAALSPVFTGRKLDVGRERELLNRYISATFSPNRNLHIRATAPRTPDAERIKTVFSEGWKAGSKAVSDIPEPSDTLKLDAPRSKVKLKTTSADAFTGGKMWTFSNGVSVIFKKTSDKNAFRYGFMVKGGWSEIPGINGTEPGFARDVLALGEVAGMSASHLSDLLAMHGVTAEPQISLSDVRLTGTAPSNSLQLVIKTMIAVANRYVPDDEAYARYLKEKPVRQLRDRYSEEGTRAVLDSISCPGYAFAAGSFPALPPADFNQRIGQFVNTKAANMKNCVIVLLGDLDEAATQKMLTNLLGGFRAGQQRVVRPRYGYPLRACWSTTYVQRDWRTNGVSIALTAKWPYGSEGYSKMLLARTALEVELNKELASDGMYCSVSGSCELLPTELMSLYIHCEPVPAYSLPSDVKQALPVRTLMTVRSVVNRLASEPLGDERLEFCKTLLEAREKAKEGSTTLLRDATLDRSSVGRDIRGGASQRIKSISAAELKALFARLSECDCEYIVQ